MRTDPKRALLFISCLAAALAACGSSNPSSSDQPLPGEPTPAATRATPTPRPVQPQPSPTGDPCAVDPDGCGCMAASCLPIPPELALGLDECAPSLLPPECAEVMLEAFNGGNCGESCKGLTVPGLEQLCEMPSCDNFLDLAGLVGASNLCQCYCEPQCDGRVCGPDGCGGVCGGCESDKSCGFGECIDVAGDCRDSDFNCFCAALECPSPVPTGPRLSLCVALQMEFPECHEVAMRAYAEEGCGADDDPARFIGAAAICASPVCQDFLELWESRQGAPLCPAELS